MRNDSLKIMKLEDGPFAILTEKQKEVIDLPMTELPIKQKEKPYFIGSFGFDTKNIITLREWFMINNTVGSKKVICCRPDQAEFFSKKHPLMTYATHFLSIRRMLEKIYGFSSKHCPLLVDEKNILKREERKSKRQIKIKVSQHQGGIEIIEENVEILMKKDIREIVTVSPFLYRSFHEFLKKENLCSGDNILVSDLLKIDTQAMRQIREKGGELLRTLSRAHALLGNKGFTEEYGPFMRFKFL